MSISLFIKKKVSMYISFFIKKKKKKTYMSWILGIFIILLYILHVDFFLY